ncbi:unnamed protein product, partial [Mesorhabditis belari]|uniref:Nose resistant-to-fluoxetine protein N-terminal domain-containing protein n=1 Tax=Mesorhabditis belari TaxID=2138241 RepID=A0AAF3EZP7_9BILA
MSIRIFLLLFLHFSLFSPISSNPSLFSDELEYDADESTHLGSLFTHFLPDSQSQLILDLDLFKHFFDYSGAYQEAIFEGDVDFVKYAIQVFDRLKDYDVSAGCLADMFHLGWTAVEYATHVKEHRNCTDCKCTPLFLQKKNDRSWIFNVLDSMGKVPAGILGGNNLWVGSFPTCRKISVKKNQQGQRWIGKYCLAHLDAYYRDNPLKWAVATGSAPDAHCFTNDSMDSTEKESDQKCFDLLSLLNFGLCVPSTCTEYDVKKMVKFAYGLVEAAVGRDLVCDVHVECRSGERERRLAESPLSQCARYLLSFISIMLIFGTSYDYLIIQKQVKTLPEKEKKEYREKQHSFLKFILAFSIYTNGQQILKTDHGGKTDQIDCLHGMRFLSMAWIILGHTYYYIGTSLTMDNLVPSLVSFPQMFYTQVIVQAPLAVDSFFYLSGLLSSYMMFKKLWKNKELPTLKNPLLWLMIYVRRYLRITPTYVFIMLLDVTVFSYFTDGPFWRPIEKTGCRIAWWTNLIYMNNFLLQDEECCMGWTWYLANDFQLQVFSPLILIPLSISPIWGFAIAGGIMGASSIMQVILMIIHDYPPAPLLTAKLQIVEKLDSYWKDVYVRPYVRCQPFIIGILVGYLLIHFTRNQKSSLRYKMNKKHLLIGWTISTILGLYSVFGLYNFSRTGDISTWYSLMYGAFGRPAYALAIAWVSFVCATGNASYVNNFLGWKFFTPLSRITFDAYLIHPILLQIYNFSRPQPFHLTTFFQMMRHTFEAVIVSYFAALCISLGVEVPTSIFEARTMRSLNSLLRPKRKRENEQEGGIELVDKSKLEENLEMKAKNEQNEEDIQFIEESEPLNGTNKN